MLDVYAFVYSRFLLLFVLLFVVVDVVFKMLKKTRVLVLAWEGPAGNPGILVQLKPLMR